MIKLNLGCGEDIKEGLVNIDHIESDGVDLVHDVEEGLPFEDSSIDYILADNLVEHLSDIRGFVRNVHRVLKNGGIIKIIVPHYRCKHSYEVHHEKYFSSISFNSYIIGENESAGLDAKNYFKKIDVNVRHKHPFCWHQRKYFGREFIAFNPQDITFVLEKVKK